MAMASSSMITSSKSALSGVAVPRNGPFTTSRPAFAPRQMVVQAQQVRRICRMYTFLVRLSSRVLVQRDKLLLAPRFGLNSMHVDDVLELLAAWAPVSLTTGQ